MGDRSGTVGLPAWLGDDVVGVGGGVHVVGGLGSQSILVVKSIHEHFFFLSADIITMS